ncbi:OmpH family outer membrane protein [Novosphingobium album (ex Liu et al. 2023)]|uniref:OmpH family outer membrane protein n=1 Tax=Novosphingobium album (ex Liu et al. 2023) TaxID=3031130 RepID=A0ABT5WPX0_9SPHN|nr:OmpH family outer membrane protein [Novosphingobium album (ex Liu et al. 2023)]MDE8652069.1 OmpH family outer membrane protein [Novosphingobium album (ex Liu et al. 2023)]
MNIILKSALAASLMAGTVAAQPALAQDAGTIVQGIAIANLEAVVANSTAFTTAEQQRTTTYKAQLDQAEARRNALNAQIKPLVDKFNVDRQGGKVTQAALEQQANAIQQIQESGQNELQRILEPVAMSRAYVSEQVEDKIDAAVKSAMAKKKISLLLSPQAVLAVNANAYNLNQDILTELNTLIPSAQLVPPAGWEPRQLREARAQQQAAAQPAAKAPAQGR